jgi:hypothetical protein
MATVTKAPVFQPRTAPAARGAEPLPVSEAPPDPLRPYFGDRIAFAVWLVCALFMAALLSYDVLAGLLQ